MGLRGTGIALPTRGGDSSFFNRDRDGRQEPTSLSEDWALYRYSGTQIASKQQEEERVTGAAYAAGVSRVNW